MSGVIYLMGSEIDPDRDIHVTSEWTIQHHPQRIGPVVMSYRIMIAAASCVWDAMGVPHDDGSDPSTDGSSWRVLTRMIKSCRGRSIDPYTHTCDHHIHVLPSDIEWDDIKTEISRQDRGGIVSIHHMVIRYHRGAGCDIEIVPDIVSIDGDRGSAGWVDVCVIDTRSAIELGKILDEAMVHYRRMMRRILEEIPEPVDLSGHVVQRPDGSTTPMTRTIIRYHPRRRSDGDRDHDEGEDG